MARVFDFLYRNEKSKKYIIYTLISLVVCLMQGRMIAFSSVAPMYTNETVLSVIQIVKLVFVAILGIYLLLDIITCKVKINWLFFVLAVLFTITYFVAHDAWLVLLLIFVYLLKQYKFEDFLKYIFIYFAAFFVIVVGLSLIGVLPNISFPPRGGVVRHGLGFTGATSAPIYLTFVTFLSIYIFKRKLPFIVIAIEVLLNTYVYLQTDTRAAFFCAIIALAVIFIVKIVCLFRKKPFTIKERKWLNVILVSLPLVSFAVFGILTIMWGGQSEFIIKVNNLLSDRLQLTYNAFKDYGVPLLGNEMIWHDAYGNYIGVDTAYYRALFRFGIINTTLFIVINMYMIWNVIKKKDYYFLFIFILILAESFVDHVMISFSSNLFLFALMNMFDWKEIRKKEMRQKLLQLDPIKSTIKTLKNVCAVVVTFNRKEMLKENIEALKAQSYKDLKILVIDNASTDGTKEYISDLIDEQKVFYFNTGANLGGAGGFNYGMKQAVILGCDYVWVMDDDCIPNKDSLKALYDNAQKLNNNFGYLSSEVLWTDGTPCNMNIQKISLGTRVDTSKTELTKIQLASFVSLFVKREIIEEVGLPIKDFFIWGDDWEYTNRISQEYDCYYCPDSVVVHKCAKNSGVDISKEDTNRIDRYKYAYRNECYLYRKNGICGIIYVILKTWLHTFKVLFSKVQDKKKRLAIIHKNTKIGFKFNPTVEYVFNKNTEVNVLEFFGEPFAYGGQEAFFINMYKNFEAKNIKYTICTPFYSTNQELINLAEKRKEEIVHYDYKFNKFKKLYIIKALRKVLKRKRIDVIHIQSGSIFTLYFAAKIAKKMGVKKVIVHSHCTGTNNFTYRLIKKYSDKRIEKCTNKFFACSLLAGKHKFPKKVIEDNLCIVIKNGIDSQRFEFKQETRKKYREKLGLKPGEFTLLHVGRFSEQKNHGFIIKIVESLKEKMQNFRFILIGDGENKEQTLKEIKDKGLEKYFIVLEKRSDVPEIMMAADMFVLPSLFEGLPVVAVEAQCSGLRTLCSDTITTETKITDLYKILPIDDAGIWAQEIAKQKGKKVEREKYASIVLKQGYDAKESASVLEKIYLGE